MPSRTATMHDVILRSRNIYSKRVNHQTFVNFVRVVSAMRCGHFHDRLS